MKNIPKCNIGLAQKEADKMEITLRNLKNLLVSSVFVLSNIIVEDVVGLCTCTYKKAMVYYSIVLCCCMYEEYYLPTNCDNVVSCIPVPSTVCISAPSFEVIT